MRMILNLDLSRALTMRPTTRVAKSPKMILTTEKPRTSPDSLRMILDIILEKALMMRLIARIPESPKMILTTEKLKTYPNPL